MVKQLEALGYPKQVAEKALFLTQTQKSVDAAVDWICQHTEDDDFNEPLTIVKGSQKKMTSEEAKEFI